ncbi:Fur family transcriptional regulator, ferric uptake regulator [Clostridium collagenovorans DSM 3089]|uniref:Fur family transcriptional regulator, ferric uptake regulator n=1 Tax=Clostridium collagenovorans DSM 3089 TaxID=1121306 RepID=A0A1M5SP30_9CLOT|nr:Fur family transcriptional regulator [Clostridium collagenovorans]SHH40245.1 Fur family transcriptional regulator, ferric uptake regulator [Clostridium collagenovorans DSM 3089]
MSTITPERVNHLKEILKERGCKLTPQRRAILNGIIDKDGDHLTVEELYDVVKTNCPELGLATVYRTVQLFEEIGLICKLDLDDGCSRYELVNEDEEHQHHHLICNNCGKVIEVEGDLLEDLEKSIEDKYLFKILNHSVKFYGLCDECRKK